MEVVMVVELGVEGVWDGGGVRLEGGVGGQLYGGKGRRGGRGQRGVGDGEPPMPEWPGGRNRTKALSGIIIGKIVLRGKCEWLPALRDRERAKEKRQCGSYRGWKVCEGERAGSDLPRQS